MAARTTRTVLQLRHAIPSPRTAAHGHVVRETLEGMCFSALRWSRVVALGGVSCGVFVQLQFFIWSIQNVALISIWNKFSDLWHKYFFWMSVFHITHFNLFIRANTSARGAFMCFCKRPKIIFLFFSYIGHGGAEKHSKYQISLSLWRVCNVMRFKNIACNASRVGISCWLRRLVCQELCVWGYFWFSYDTLCCGLRASLCQGLKINIKWWIASWTLLYAHTVLLAVNGHGSVSSHPSWKTFLMNPKGLSWQFVESVGVSGLW